RPARGQHHQQAATGVLQRVVLARVERHELALPHALGGAARPDQRLALEDLVDDGPAGAARPRLAGLEADELAGEVAGLHEPAGLDLGEREAAGVRDVDGLHALLPPLGRGAAVAPAAVGPAGPACG